MIYNANYMIFLLIFIKKVEDIMKKIMIMFGTRPELIKLVPLMKLLDDSSEFQYINVSTGQHKEMLSPIIKTFQLSINYDLSIMKKHQTITEVTVSILKKMEPILMKENPDIVLVHGDTTTAFTSALAAYYQKIPIAHVEAGLRSKNIYSPFPEEMNRKLIDHLSSIHFPPTKKNEANLLIENIDSSTIFITGNTAIDMFKHTIKKDFYHELLTKCENKKIVLLTVHRRENIGKPMIQIFSAINRLLNAIEDIVIIFPIHFNPIVRELAKKHLTPCDRLLIIDPMEVTDFHNIMAKSYLILSDSGGIQEEAPFLGIPTIILRNETERPEAVDSGINYLAGTEEKKIYEIAYKLLTDQKFYQSVAKKQLLYGDGFASEKIENSLKQYFELNQISEL